ncbi:hypothetical protein VSR68_07565 [Paraburkholderia phymatum]
MGYRIARKKPVAIGFGDGLAFTLSLHGTACGCGAILSAQKSMAGA